MKIFVGIPCMTERYGWIVPGLCVWLLKKASLPGVDVEIGFECGAFPVTVARNRLVRYAQRSNASWLLMIDNDQIPPPDLLNSLKIADERGIDVLAVTTPMFREEDRFPLPNISGELLPQANLDDEMFEEVADIGSGVMAIRLSVFERLPRPYFRMTSPDSGFDGEICTEDWNFCRDVRKLGFRIFTLRNVFAKHLKTVDLAQYYKAIRGL